MSRRAAPATTPAPGLDLGDGLVLPLDAATQTFGIVAVRGAGKTHLASVLVEEMVRADLPVVVVDPVGVWWGLRLSADGKGSGLAVVILGGDHGDLPLEPGAGELVADLVAESRRSVVLDLSSMRRVAQQEFMADFAEALLRLNRQPLHLVIDEADRFAPQNARGKQNVLEAVEEIVRRGRAPAGIGVTLVSQRAAVLNKNVLSQVGTLICLRMGSPQDQKAIEGWVSAHGTEGQRETMLASLASLPTGTAWVSSPEWLKAFKKVEIRQRRTYDSSATPAPSTSGSLEPRPALAPFDLEVFRRRMAALVVRGAEGDPAVLKRKIAKLEEELRKEKARADAAPAIRDADLILGDFDNLDAQIAEVRRWLKDASRLLADLDHLDSRIADVRGSLGMVLGSAPASPKARPRAREPEPRAHPDAAVADVHVKAGGRTMLARLRQFRARGLTRVELGTLAGISAGTGTFSEYLSALRRAGFAHEEGGRLYLTETGLAEAPAVEIRDARDVLALWSNRLKAGARRMLEGVLAAPPAGLNRAELGAKAGIAPSTGTFSEYLSKLRRAGLVVVAQKIHQGPAFDVLAEGGPKG